MIDTGEGKIQSKPWPPQQPVAPLLTSKDLTFPQPDADYEVVPTAYVEGSTKFDGGKARMELVPLDAVKEVAKVLTFGAAKYAADGWRGVESHRYQGALLRHLEAIQQGEENDPDSGLPHIAHVACNALFLTHFHIRPEQPVAYTEGAAS